MEFKKPRGTNDWFGKEVKEFELVVNKLKTIAKNYSFSEIKTPTFESSNLFNKAVGETSDIVSKELYTFEDKSNRSMCLRPEGTAGVVRAYVENKMFGNQSKVIKFFYLMNMFRYERPQTGRLREFHQFGVEYLKTSSIYDDVEIIMFAKNILDDFKIKDFKLKINNLGNFESRSKWVESLKEYFSKYKNELSEDSINRLDKNPLRILDDKVDSKKDFVKKAPKLKQFLSKEEIKDFEEICNLLNEFNIDYEIDEFLVRGLDYYSGLVFEFVSTNDILKSKETILAGGRYSKLISHTGGPDNEGLGFAIGIERFIMLLKENNNDFFNVNNKIIYVASETNNKKEELEIISLLRTNNFVVENDFSLNDKNKHFKSAQKAKYEYLVFVNANEIIVKNLNKKTTETIQRNQLIDFFKERI